MASHRAHFRFSQRAARTTEQPIGYLMAAALEQPGLISLAAGLVDYPTLPSDEARALFDELLAPGPDAKAAMQYGTTEGFAALRHAILDHLAALDGLTPEQLNASADDLVITTGSQQLLCLLTDVLVDPGDIVITEWPSYFVYTGVLRTAGATVRCVDMDDQGMRPDDLERVLADIAHRGELTKVKIVYVCDYHQNPTGLTLSRERRPAILDIVRRYSAEHRILLIEDAAYRELTFAGPQLPSIRTFDTTNEYVALLQTFSKPFAPGLKTGYGLLPRDLVEPVALLKGNHDFGSANLSQHLLLRAMRQGIYQRHVRLLCGHYGTKAAAMTDALRDTLGDYHPGQTRWTMPAGGLYVWLTLPEGTDTGRSGALFSRAIAEGVLYVPGEYCYNADPTRRAPTNQMRLSFGTARLDEIREGIARLARAVKSF